MEKSGDLDNSGDEERLMLLANEFARPLVAPLISMLASLLPIGYEGATVAGDVTRFWWFVLTVVQKMIS